MAEIVNSDQHFQSFRVPFVALMLMSAIIILKANIFLCFEIRLF